MLYHTSISIKGGYYHELFLRGKVSLAYDIHRMRVKGTGVRLPTNPDAEPNFYLLPPVTKVSLSFYLLFRRMMYYHILQYINVSNTFFISLFKTLGYSCYDNSIVHATATT